MHIIPLLEQITSVNCNTVISAFHIVCQRPETHTHTFLSLLFHPRTSPDTTIRSAQPIFRWLLPLPVGKIFGDYRGLELYCTTCAVSQLLRLYVLNREISKSVYRELNIANFLKSQIPFYHEHIPLCLRHNIKQIMYIFIRNKVTGIIK